MQKFKHTLLLLVALCLFNTAFGQVKPDTSKNTDPSLKGQYAFMLKKSRDLYGAKLINPTRLSALWKSVSDTLLKERKQLATAKKEIKAQNETIASIKGEMSGKESSLASANAALNEIKFLGISFEKSTYNSMVWIIIGVLAIAVTFLIFQMGKFKKEATYRTELYQEVADEYQAHKAKAKEKEMKLARELQDERNKWDESRGR